MGTIDVEASTGRMLLGAQFETADTTVPLLLKTKPTSAAIMHADQVPWGWFKLLVADGSLPPEMKLSPPMTLDTPFVQSKSAGVLTGSFATPVSMTATMTPSPSNPWPWSVLAPVSRLLKV